MEERLRKFAYLVDAGSFTKAALELHISQPALSSAIAKLERELKAPLLVKGARPLALTPAGQLAYQAAKDLAVQTENLKLRLAELADEPVALRIGMIDSVASAFFADSANPTLLDSAKVSIVVNHSRYLSDLVERGELDVAFVAEQPKRPSGLMHSTSVGIEPLVVVAGARRPTLHGKVLPDFLSYDQSSNTFRLVQRALRDYGVSLRANFYSTSPEIMLRLVLAGKGVAALPYLLVRDHIKDAKVRRLGGKTPWLIPRNIVALKRRDKELPLEVKKLTQQIATMLEALTSEAQTGGIE